MVAHNTTNKTMLLQAMNNRLPGAAHCIALCCLLLVAALRCEAQNLVPNPGFEEVDSCPQWPVVLNYSPGARPTHWYTCSESPEYFNACVDTMTGVPSNLLAYQPAFEGQAYSGMFTYGSLGEYREMIGAELIAPLDSGQTYYVSFRVNAAMAGELFWPTRATNNIGVLFTMQANEWLFGDPPFGFRDFAHVYSTAVINDTLGWTLVNGSFVADSAYRYLVIGNHFRDSLTAIEVLDPDTVLGFNIAYTFVDDVCVSLDPEGCPLVNGLHGPDPQVMIIAPNPAEDEIEVVVGSGFGSIMVVDMSGRLVFASGVGASGGARIDVSAWPSGMYVLTIGEGSRKHRKKFVVL